jgi:hypothetical protein
VNTFLRAIRTTDSAARVNSTTLTDDDILTMSVDASVTYDVEFNFDFTGSNAVNAKFGFNFPAGSTLYVGGWALTTALAVTPWYQYAPAASTATVVGTAGTGSFRPTTGSGTLITGTTPGTFVVQWAQNTLDAVNGIVLRAGSRIHLVRPPS